MNLLYQHGSWKVSAMENNTGKHKGGERRQQQGWNER